MIVFDATLQRIVESGDSSKNNQRTLIQANLCFLQDRSGHRARRTRGALLLILPVSRLFAGSRSSFSASCPVDGAWSPRKLVTTCRISQGRLGETDRGPARLASAVTLHYVKHNTSQTALTSPTPGGVSPGPASILSQTCQRRAVT